MSEITSFPINTVVFNDLDPITDAQATDADGVLFFDESVGVMKRMTRGELFKGKVIPINSIADFAAIDVGALSNRQQFHLNSFAPTGSSGGGPLLWAPDKSKLLHDGIRYFSPTVPIPADFDNPTDVQNYMDGVGEEFPTADGIFELTLFSIQSSEFPAVDGAFVLWDGVSGNQVKNGVVPSTIGVNALQIPNITEVSYSRYNADESISMRTLVEHKTDLAINNVDNTSDADKPISDAAQAALNLKAPISNPAFTGNPTAPTPTTGDNDTSIATTAFVQNELVDRVQSVENIADLSAITGASEDQEFSVLGTSAPNDLGFSNYIKALTGYTEDGHFVVGAPDAGQFLRQPGFFDTSTTIVVGSGERFTTLTAALIFCSTFKPVGWEAITLQLKAGFVLSEQVLLENLDLRHVMITSVDAVVNVARSAITASWRGIIPTFGFAKCFAPVFSVLFEMDTSGSDLDQYGIVCRTSQFRSEFGAGFRNTPNRNFEATWGSIADIRYFDASGAGDIGIRISNGAYGYIRTCKANGCATGVSVSNAIADFTDGEATGCQFSGAATGGGMLLVSNATITGNVLSGSLDHANVIAEFGGKIIGTGVICGGGSVDAVRADGGEVYIDFLVAASPGRYVLHALNGGTIKCPRSTLSGGTVSINCVDSEISFPGSTVSLPTNGQILFSSGGKVDGQACLFTSTATISNSIFSGSDGAKVNLSKSTCNNGAIQLFRFLRGCELTAPSFTATGNTIASGQLCRFDASNALLSNSNLSGRAGGTGVQANLGSQVNVTNTNCWSVTGVDSAGDINIATGSFIHAHSASGGLNVAANAITSAGIIFK